MCICMCMHGMQATVHSQCSELLLVVMLLCEHVRSPQVICAIKYPSPGSPNLVL